MDYSATAGIFPLLGALLALGAAVAVYFLLDPVWIFLPAGLFLLFAGMALHQGSRIRRRRQALETLYGSREPDQWIRSAQSYRDAWDAWQSGQASDRASRAQAAQRLAALRQQLISLCQGSDPETTLQKLHQAQQHRAAYQDALRDQQQLNRHLQDLQTMARTAPKPPLEDTLTYTEEQTQVLLNDAILE